MTSGSLTLVLAVKYSPSLCSVAFWKCAIKGLLVNGSQETVLRNYSCWMLLEETFIEAFPAIGKWGRKIKVKWELSFFLRGTREGEQNQNKRPKSTFLFPPLCWPWVVLGQALSSALCPLRAQPEIPCVCAAQKTSEGPFGFICETEENNIEQKQFYAQVSKEYC